MKEISKVLLSIITALTVFSLAFIPAPASAFVPVTGQTNSLSVANSTVHFSVQSLDTFSTSVSNGNSSQLAGIYVSDNFGFPVIQQPSGNASYISSQNNTFTQFSLASNYGSIGILAHNYLAGKYLNSMYSGEVISLVYGDGSVKNFTVSEVRKYQALTPSSQYSDFVNLNDSSKNLTSSDLFMETFGLNGALVMQTCISKDGNSSWGRLFVIAYAS